MYILASFLTLGAILFIGFLEWIPQWIGPVLAILAAYLLWRRERKIGIFLAIIGLGLITYNLLYPSGLWRYRIDLAIETPEGIVTGSTVNEVTMDTSPNFGMGYSFYRRVKGQAVVLDLGKQGLLFALMRGDKKGGVDYGENILFRIYYPRGGGGCQKLYVI